MTNVNVEKEVCQLTQAFYISLIEGLPPINPEYRMQLKMKAFEEASNIVQDKIRWDSSLPNIEKEVCELIQSFYVSLTENLPLEGLPHMTVEHLMQLKMEALKEASKIVQIKLMNNHLTNVSET